MVLFDGDVRLVAPAAGVLLLATPLPAVAAAVWGHSNAVHGLFTQLHFISD